MAGRRHNQRLVIAHPSNAAMVVHSQNGDWGLVTPLLPEPAVALEKPSVAGATVKPVSAGSIFGAMLNRHAGTWAYCTLFEPVSHQGIRMAGSSCSPGAVTSNAALVIPRPVIPVFPLMFSD